MSDQADRIEALLVVVSDQLKQLLDSMAGEVRQQPLDPSVWPDWYRDLFSLPNFKKTLTECEQWLVEKNIGEEKADQTASYMRSVWPGTKPRPWKQPWATFTNLVKRYPPGTQGPSRPAPAAEGDKYMTDYKNRRGTQSSRR